ncbi:MAG: LolA family protein [Acetobacteraceae bacterium]
MIPRRLLLAAPLLLAAAPAPTEDAAELGRIAAYLNGIHTLKAHFLQVAPDGRISEGTAWVDRPGRMRFAYAPPTPYLLVAGSGLVMFHDRQLDQTSTVPLDRTPLGILLAPRIRFSGSVKVTAIRRLPGEIMLTLIRAAAPEQGSLTLVFSTDPLLLRQWSVLDPQHQRTTVTLTDIETGGRFPPGLFNVAQPQQRMGSGGNG